jgi:proline iminopeptidase
MYSDREIDAQIAFVRICAHFFSNDAWLAKAWPDARLHIIEDSGHAGSDALTRTVWTAIEEFKASLPP